MWLVHIAGFMVEQYLLTKVSDMLTAVHAKQKFGKTSLMARQSKVLFFSFGQNPTGK